MVTKAASMTPTVRVRAAVLLGVGGVAALAVTSCSSAAKPAPPNTKSPTVASATPPTTSLAAASQPPAAASAGLLAEMTVSGAENLKLTASNVKCEKTVAADGSALVHITVLTPNTGVGWELTITSSADSAAAFAAPLTYDLAARNGPATINFLEANGSLGAGWINGYTSGAQLAGTLALKPDQSGTIDSQLSPSGQLGASGLAKLPIHLVASWKCGPTTNPG